MIYIQKKIIHVLMDYTEGHTSRAVVTTGERCLTKSASRELQEEGLRQFISCLDSRPHSLVGWCYTCSRVFKDSLDNLQHWCYTSATSDMEANTCTLFNSYSVDIGLLSNQGKS